MSSSLPNELHEHIVSYVTFPSDLCRLARVSLRLNPIAERELYWSVSMSGDGFERIHHKISSHPRPWALVRHLEILPYPWPAESGGYLALFDTLPLLTGLKHFTLDKLLSFDNPKTGKRSCILQNVTAPLETLIVQRIDPIHIHLLEKNTQLRQLIMGFAQTPWNTTAFPNLHILGGPADIMYTCLVTTATPSLKVERLKWNHGVIKAWPILTFIRSVEVTLYSLEIAELVHTVEKFPGLEYLKCNVMRAGFLQLVDDEDRQLLSTLDLPSLHKVYLHFAGWSNHDVKLQCLFDAITSLQIVQLHLKDSARSRCWRRHDPSAYTVIPPEEDEWKYYNSPVSTSTRLDLRLVGP